jgi:hypothetical protein
MVFQREVKLNLDKPAPQQWNGEQDCQKCGNKLGWNKGISVCGHVRHSPSWEEQVNGVLSELVKCEPGDTLSTSLIERARVLVKSASVEEWARKAYDDGR